MVVFTVLLGLVYPLAVTGIAQVAFGAKADGDTTLIAARHARADPHYFQPRPSQTGYNANGDVLLQPRARTSRALRYFYRDQLAAYIALNGPYTPA